MSSRNIKNAERIVSVVILTQLRWWGPAKELCATVKSWERYLCRILGHHLLQYPNDIHNGSQLTSHYREKGAVSETDSQVTTSTDILWYFIFNLSIFFYFPDLFWISGIITVFHSMYNCKLDSRVNIITKEDIKIQMASFLPRNSDTVYVQHSHRSLSKSNNFASKCNFQTSPAFLRMILIYLGVNKSCFITSRINC